MTDDTGWRVSFEATPNHAPLIENAIETATEVTGEVPPTMSFFEIDEREEFEVNNDAIWRFQLFFPEKPTEVYLTTIMTGAELSDLTYALEPIEDRDWVSESQKLLHPVSAGRILVFGSHDNHLMDTAEICLQVDAGQAFGTGQHETTHGCLTFLDSLFDTLAPAKILDLGTGSGVLAMAAAKAWDAQILATDIDAKSIEVTEYNMGLNHISTRELGADGYGVATLVADGLDDEAFSAEGPFDLVFANILSGPLIELAESVTSAMAVGGLILLAGLRQVQESEVLAAYEQRGLVLIGRSETDGWPTLMLKKQ